MVKILSLLVLCVVLFAGGLAAALYLRPQPGDDENAASADGDGGKMGAETTNVSTGSVKPNPELPTPVHGRPMSTDDLFRFTASIRGRERELKRREADLEQRESRLKMMEEDLRGQRREVDGLMGNLQDTLESTTLVLQKVNQQRAELKKERAAATQDLKRVKQLQEESDAAEDTNIAKLAEWLESMDEQQGAAYLKELANTGQMDMAVKILANVEGRNVAKFLGAIGDPALMVQLSNEFKKYRRPPPRKR